MKTNFKTKMTYFLSFALLGFGACKKSDMIQDRVPYTGGVFYAGPYTDKDFVITWGWNDFPIGPSGDLVRMCADNPKYNSVILIPDSTDYSIVGSTFFVAERWERIADSFFVYKAYNPEKVKFAGNLYVNPKGGCHLPNDTTNDVAGSKPGMFDKDYDRLRGLGLNIFSAPAKKH